MKNVRVFLSVAAMVLAFGAVSAFRPMPSDIPGYEFVDLAGTINDRCDYIMDCQTNGTVDCRVDSSHPILHETTTPNCGKALKKTP